MNRLPRHPMLNCVGMEVERTIEFILDQQAKFWTGLEEMRGRQAEHERFVLRLAEHQLELTQNVERIQREFSGMMLTLAEEQKRLAEEQRLLAESQRHTDERLNALIEIVNGLVRRRPQA